MDFETVMLALVLAVAGAILAIWVMNRAGMLGPVSVGPLFARDERGVVFLFDDENLVDASGEARALLHTLRPRGGHPWARLISYAVPRFPGLEAALAQLPESGRAVLSAADGTPLSLIAEWRGGLRRIELHETHLETSPTQIDALTLQVQTEELETLRQFTEAAPFPIWLEHEETGVTWANRSYGELARRRSGDAENVPSWPLPQIFGPLRQQPGRLRLTLPDAKAALWFDTQSVPVASGLLGFAVPADRTVQAEDALRSFVQTLTKTFANLPIGLAIFDAERRLQLFNPALIDLTGLPVPFLSSRPGFFAFLDEMRLRRMIPEPRHYREWRAQMAALETSASEGSYDETWALPSGVTYRVMGRPHPEGALALLLQDITDEMTRARRAQAETALGQAVIDVLDEAICVFAPSGHMVMSNAAYARLWGHNPTETAEEATIGALCARWRQGTMTGTVWPLAEAFILAPAPRDTWHAEARLNDGRILACRFVPLPGGATLIGFHFEAAQDASRPANSRVESAPALPGLAKAAKA